MKNEEIWNQIRESDMILIGLGEEFDFTKQLKKYPQYEEGCRILKEAGLYWAVPAWNMFFADKMEEEHPMAAWNAFLPWKTSTPREKLMKLLEGKDYFVVSTSVNDQLFFGDDRFVMPCGGSLKKQCGEGCEEVLQAVTEEDRKKLRQGFEILYEGERRFHGGEDFREKTADFFQIGKCPKCGAGLVLNNIYAENYNEQGYMELWNTYKKWLQGTLNRRLLVLELGVGMQYPSVIRWPFEKAAFFNQKAFFCRVNETLYQLTEELSGKGCGISMNAIDWLCQLC